jgi:o-succinylbenzoate synthase
MKLELRRLELKSPGARDARRSWPVRRSLLVRLDSGRGPVGLGEASPLPGYSPDTLDDAEQALHGVDRVALEQALAQPVARAALRATAALLPARLPAARMALETAALDLLGKLRDRPAPLLLGAEAGAERPLSFLLGPASASDLEQRAQAAIDAGFRQLKLKLGAEGALDRELAGVVGLRKRFGAGVSLRLDANRALRGVDVARAWETLEGVGIEFFEEPGELPEALLGRVPLALDESLQGLSESELDAKLRQLRPRCLVLKPMALGGLDHCWQLAERAREQGADAVVSHCFEGPLGYRAAASLALALPRGPAHGLGAHEALAGWGKSLGPAAASLSVWREPGLGDLESLWS